MKKPPTYLQTHINTSFPKINESDKEKIDKSEKERDMKKPLNNIIKKVENNRSIQNTSQNKNKSPIKVNKPNNQNKKGIKKTKITIIFFY